MRLFTAGNAVKKATDNLVQAAQESLDATRERTITLDRRRVGGIAQEISANVRFYQIFL
jgi:talin